MKKIFLLFSLAVGAMAYGNELEVTSVKYAGPYPINAYLAVGDTTGMGSNDAMKIALPMDSRKAQSIELTGIAPGYDGGEALHMLYFDVENRGYSEGKLSVEGLGEHQIYVDGKESGPSLKLNPATHAIAVKYFTKAGATDSLRIKLATTKGAELSLSHDGKRIMTLDDMMCGVRIRTASMSPSGEYLLASYYEAFPDEKQEWWQVLYDSKNMKPIARVSGNAQWLPNADKYYVTRKSHEHGRHIVVVDPKTGTEEILADHLPAGQFSMGPTGDFLVYALTREGHKEDSEIYQVLEPDDRQPGWRDRSYPAIYRIDTGALMPLTAGKQNTFVSDISRDGKKALVLTSKSRLQKRPTTVSTLMLLDLATLQADSLVVDDGFLGQAMFSPDGKKAIVKGTPEAFCRIGCVLPDSVIPSMIQQELFIIDLATKDVTPLTRDFDPSIEDVEWSVYDNKIYVRVEDRDMYRIYQIDPANGAYKLIDLPENVLSGFNLAEKSPVMAIWGQSDSNPDRLYVHNLKTGKSSLLDSPSQTRLEDVRLAKCEDWNFVNSKGDTIYGRYYLPDDFDPEKKYPLIVNYYGGCSPTQRRFESRYPHHLYAEQGYVVYVLNPSGATGFGQEFSSRHVNTAGDGPAQDIIEGTQKFLEAHPYVDASKVGCIGASYGGFMTMYLQTVTDIFAAAISHAGISDHTSYWGEGYWGYSYSETSMAESYPWTNKHLYVDQSPLFNADKVHTPLLFLHGDSDTNVPVGESIQMFTALKLLDRPTALVQVTGEDHHINKFSKRRKWQNTIFAWFAKYLKDDPTWWDAMYPEL